MPGECTSKVVPPAFLVVKWNKLWAVMSRWSAAGETARIINDRLPVVSSFWWGIDLAATTFWCDLILLGICHLRNSRKACSGDFSFILIKNARTVMSRVRRLRSHYFISVNGHWVLSLLALHRVGLPLWQIMFALRRGPPAYGLSTWPLTNCHDYGKHGAVATASCSPIRVASGTDGSFYQA